MSPMAVNLSPGSAVWGIHVDQYGIKLTTMILMVLCFFQTMDSCVICANLGPIQPTRSWNTKYSIMIYSKTSS